MSDVIIEKLELLVKEYKELNVIIEKLELLVKEYKELNVLGEFVITESEFELVVSHLKLGLYSGDFLFVIHGCAHWSSHDATAYHVTIIDASDIYLVLSQEDVKCYFDVYGKYYEP